LQKDVPWSCHCQ